MVLMRLRDLLLGQRLPSDEEEEHRVGVWEGVPMLGLDALGSASYGPEAALTLLMPLGVAGTTYLGPIIVVILALLAILYFSYRQTITAYPNGGGSYIVARKNLGDIPGLLAAAALSLDYLLNVAVGIAAGVGALVSAVPALHGHILALCLGILALITLVNLRGVRESGLAWALPTYLFVVSLIGVVGTGVIRIILHGGHPAPIAPPPHPETSTTATATVSLWLLLRAFASGCTAMTGVEAVSNGVTAFADPRDKRARQTLTAIVVILAILLAGIAFVTRAYHVLAMDQEKPGYQSVISQIVAAVVGHGAVYYVTIVSVLAVLCLSANTSFADFPRLCRLLAEDGYLPTSFANKGRRLVFATGIIILAVLSALILIAFGGITDQLIPLFAVGAFLAFTLSQAGMVAHWRRELKNRKGREAHAARFSLTINSIGCVTTAIALGIILIAKFRDGAWLTVLLIPALLWLFLGIHRHYERIRQEINCDLPINLGKREPPLLVVPVSGWNSITAKALQFAYQISEEVVAVHVGISSGGDEQDRANDDEETLRRHWKMYVEEPLTSAGIRPPELIVLPSPYRLVFSPLLRYLKRLERDHSERQIGVVIPELVESRWWHYPLHNQQATALKAALLFHGGKRVTVMNVPWYAGKDADCRK